MLIMDDAEIEKLLQSAEQSLQGKPAEEPSIIEQVRAIPKLKAEFKPARVVKSTAPALKTLGHTKKLKDDNAGEQWFGLGRPEMTPELKRDLSLLQMRHAFDPKRFYKAADERSKYFAMGTLQADATEFYTRAYRKDRKQTLAQELLASRPDYFKSRYDKIQGKKKSGGRGHYKKVRNMRA